MSYHGVSNWPPAWVQVASSGSVMKVVRGEEGILTSITYGGRDEKKFYLTIEHEGERYMGTLLFDDPAFAYLVSNLLSNRIGWSITAIADLDASYSL
jgi:hypothetical protein